MINEYEGLPEFVLETSHGYYSEYGWGLASTFDKESEAKEKCDFWNSKGGEYRVVSGGELVYPIPEQANELLT